MHVCPCERVSVSSVWPAASASGSPPAQRPAPSLCPWASLAFSHSCSASSSPPLWCPFCSDSSPEGISAKETSFTHQANPSVMARGRHPESPHRLGNIDVLPAGWCCQIWGSCSSDRSCPWPPCGPSPPTPDSCDVSLQTAQTNDADLFTAHRVWWGSYGLLWCCITNYPDFLWKLLHGLLHSSKLPIHPLSHLFQRISHLCAHNTDRSYQCINPHSLALLVGCWNDDVFASGLVVVVLVSTHLLDVLHLIVKVSDRPLSCHHLLLSVRARPLHHAVHFGPMMLRRGLWHPIGRVSRVLRETG